MRLYLIGSLRNPEVPLLAERLRGSGHEVFDDWFAAGPEADDMWQRYEQARGRSYSQALAGYAAGHVFEFDKHHLDLADGGILLLPAGKSGHLELGYMIGQGKPCFILCPVEPERFDVMYKFATGVFSDEKNLMEALDELRKSDGPNGRPRAPLVAPEGNRAEWPTIVSFHGCTADGRTYQNPPP